MASIRGIAGLGAGVLVAAGLALAPAIHAQGRESRAVSIDTARIGGIGKFTPAAADPKLAAQLALRGVGDPGLRFTPSESRRALGAASVLPTNGRRSASLRSADRERVSGTIDQIPSVSLTPISYNLSATPSRSRALSADATRFDLVSQPGSIERPTVATGDREARSAVRVTPAQTRAIEDTPPAIRLESSQSIDVGGSYSLTRNLDVTAGVRYERQERERLPRLTEEEQNDKAVYVGTAFRF